MNDEGTDFYIPEVERGYATDRKYTQIKWRPLPQTYRYFPIIGEEGMINLGYSGVLSTGSSSTSYTPADLAETYTTTRAPQAGTAKKETTTVQKYLSEMSNEQLRNYVKNLKGNI